MRIQCLWTKHTICSNSYTDDLAAVSNLMCFESCLQFLIVYVVTVFYRIVQWPKFWLSVVVTATLIRTDEVVRFLTRYRIWVVCMASPSGSSAQFCCSKFGFSISYMSFSVLCVTTILSTTFFCSLDPCVVAVSRVLLELTVRNGSISLSSDFIDVDSVINFLCILRVRSYN